MSYRFRRADVAQLVEHRLPKPKVAGSRPVVRFSVIEPYPVVERVSGGLNTSPFIRSKPPKTGRTRWRLARNWRARCATSRRSRDAPRFLRNTSTSCRGIVLPAATAFPAEPELEEDEELEEEPSNHAATPPW